MLIHWNEFLNRTHWNGSADGNCATVGRFVRGHYFLTHRARCMFGAFAPHREWFKVGVYVHGDQATAYFKGFHVITWKTHFTARGRVGVMTHNGLGNTVHFRKFKLVEQ